MTANKVTPSLCPVELAHATTATSRTRTPVNAVSRPRVPTHSQRAVGSLLVVETGLGDSTALLGGDVDVRG